MVEKENATGFTMSSKIQQYKFEIARLIPVNLHSNIRGMVKMQLNFVQLYYNRHLPSCIASSSK
jgi:hypothetical protein